MKKTAVTKVFMFFLLLFFNGVFAQNYLVVFTKPKGNGGCNDMRYQKIEIKNKDDYWKQSEALRKQYANETYKDYYVSAEEHAIVVEYTGQHNTGSCKFRKYEFARSKKSLEDARAFIQKQATDYKDLYASSPQEVSVFSSSVNTAEKGKSEKQLGDVYAKFYISKRAVVAQLKNSNTTKSIVVKISTLDADKNIIAQKTEILKKGSTLIKSFGQADFYEVHVSDAYEEKETEEKEFIETIKQWIYKWLVKKQDLSTEKMSAVGVRG